MINRSSRPITTLFGIPLHLHWSAMLIALFVAVSASTAVGISDAALGAKVLVGGLAALLFAMSLIIHEYAHALVARRNGIGVRRVSLWALGGLAELEQEPRRWTHEFAVSIAGPLASLALGAFGLVSALALSVMDAAVPMRLFVWLGVINIVLGLFNLLPGLPLDGGRVLHSLIWWRTKNRHRATVITAGTGRIIGFILIGFGAVSVVTGGSGFFTALIGYFIVISAKAASKSAKQSLALGEVTAGSVARPVPPAVNETLTVSEFLAYWLPYQSSEHTALITVDGDGRTTGLVPMASIALVPTTHRDALTLGVIAIPASAMATVSPDTLLADALSYSSSGIILVALPDRVTGIIMPVDLRDDATREAGPSDTPTDNTPTTGMAELTR